MLLVSGRVCPQMSKEMAVLHVNEAFQLLIRSAWHGPNSSCIDHLLILFLVRRSFLDQVEGAQLCLPLHVDLLLLLCMSKLIQTNDILVSKLTAAYILLFTFAGPSDSSTHHREEAH